jgi:hypothetical protein
MLKTGYKTGFRIFMIVSILASAQSSILAQSKEKPRDPGIIFMRAGMKLSQKISMIQKHIETNHYGSKTIPVSMPYDGGISGEIRSWNNNDFIGKSIPAFKANVPGKPPVITTADWLNNENSSYLSGGYLLSQVYRYQVTREKVALDECPRALRAIKFIADLAGPDQYGWICKPFGERANPHSSPDQNIYIVQGLWAFLPYANAEQAKFIRSIIPAIADYWERINYTILSGNTVWDMRKGIILSCVCSM